MTTMNFVVLNCLEIPMACRCYFVMVGQVLGIGTEDPTAYFEGKKSKTLREGTVDQALVEKLIDERTQARKEKDWSRADQIRDQLEAMNVVLEDRPGETVWKTKG